MTRVKLEQSKNCVISPTAANGPIGMIFGMGMDIDQSMPIFGKSKSKVKVKIIQKTGFCSDFQ